MTSYFKYTKMLKKILNYLIILVCVCSVLLVYSKANRKNYSLKVNITFSKAVIIKFSTGPRMRNYIDYKFIVNEKLYEGTGRYYPKDDVLSVGDSIMIVYDKTNPNNNKAMRDYYK